MSEKLIEISTNLSSEDLRRILYRQVRTKLIILGCLIFVFIAFILLGVSVSLLSGKNNLPLTALLPILIPVFIFSLVLFLLLWMVNKQAKRSGENAEETKFTFNEQGMESESASVSAKVLWTKFYAVKENATDFLLYTQKNIAIPLPKRFFESENQIIDLKNLLREKLGDKTKLKN